MYNRTILENITVEFDEKDFVTLTNVHYSDLQSILTSAVLYNNDDERKAMAQLKAIDPKSKEAEYKLETHEENVRYCIERDLIIRVIEQAIKHEIERSHNKKLRPFKYEPKYHDPYGRLNDALEEKKEEIRRAKLKPDLTPPEQKTVTYYPVNSPVEIPAHTPLLAKGEYGMDMIVYYRASQAGGERQFFSSLSDDTEVLSQKVVKWAKMP